MQAGFESEDICVSLSPDHPIIDMRAEYESAICGFVRRSRLGADGLMVVDVRGSGDSGVGLFVGSREYLHALAQSDCRLEGEGNGGVLASLGIPEEVAVRYEARVRRDASLVFVSCDGSAQSEWQERFCAACMPRKYVP